MPIPLVIIGAAFVIGCIAIIAKSNKQTTIGSELPIELLRCIVSVCQHKSTPIECRSAALLAFRIGQPKLGRALKNEADILEGVEIAKLEIGRFSAREQKYLSPIPQANDDQWTAYVRRSRLARPDAISPSYRLGVYALSTRDLADVGLVLDAHKESIDGKMVWLGDWTDGHNLEEFLADQDRQYDALVRLSKLHFKIIVSTYDNEIGKEIDGAKVTLSGLMGVARRAGLGGLAKWVANSEDRKKFTATTEQFARLNGIF